MTSRGTAPKSTKHGVAKHRVRGIRIPATLWVAAQAKAAEEGKSVSAVVRGFLYDWTGVDEEGDDRG